MPGKSKYLVILISLVALTVIAACSEEQVPTQVPVEFSPTEAPVVERQGSEIKLLFLAVSSNQCRKVSAPTARACQS